MTSTDMDDPMNSMLNPDVTFHMDKYSCVASFFAIHVTFNYLIFISGLLCFITRFVPGTQWLHKWLGRAYILFMLWSTVSSLLIHNTGLPTGVLISFLWVLLGLSIGWGVINAHQVKMQQAAEQAVGAALEHRPRGGGPVDITALVAEEKGKIAEKKTFQERLFSYKALHGALMFMSWTNIAGRIFSTKFTKPFTCHTYPYYKQINVTEFAGASSPLTPVSVHDPKFLRTPWGKTGLAGWGVLLSLGPLAAAYGVGAGWSWAEAERGRKRRSLGEAPPLVAEMS